MNQGAPRQEKGTSHNQYKCGICQAYGHNSRNCVIAQQIKKVLGEEIDRIMLMITKKLLTIFGMNWIRFIHVLVQFQGIPTSYPFKIAH